MVSGADGLALKWAAIRLAPSGRGIRSVTAQAADSFSLDLVGTAHVTAPRSPGSLRSPTSPRKRGGVTATPPPPFRSYSAASPALEPVPPPP
jgi:hypothetical protein